MLSVFSIFMETRTMSDNMPVALLIEACSKALDIAVKRYIKSAGPLAKRRPPESFVQHVVAEQLALVQESPVLIEEKTKDIVNNKCKKLPRNDTGRVDVAVYDNSGHPKIVIEIKIIKEIASLNEDCKRIGELMDLCPEIKCGIMIGYCYGKNSENLESLLNSVGKQLDTIVQEINCNSERTIAFSNEMQVEFTKPFQLDAINGRRGHFDLQGAIYLIRGADRQSFLGS